jgi:hypothetical protein
VSNTNIVKVKGGNSIGSTHDTFNITQEAVTSVNVINTHATQQLYVKPYTGTTAAAALAAAVAATAIAANGDGAYHVPPASARRVNVFTSKRPTFVCLDVIGSGASTTFDVEASSQ